MFFERVVYYLLIGSFVYVILKIIEYVKVKDLVNPIKGIMHGVSPLDSIVESFTDKTLDLDMTPISPSWKPYEIGSISDICVFLNCNTTNNGSDNSNDSPQPVISLNSSSKFNRERPTIIQRPSPLNLSEQWSDSDDNQELIEINKDKTIEVDEPQSLIPSPSSPLVCPVLKPGVFTPDISDRYLKVPVVEYGPKFLLDSSDDSDTESSSTLINKKKSKTATPTAKIIKDELEKEESELRKRNIKNNEKEKKSKNFLHKSSDRVQPFRMDSYQSPVIKRRMAKYPSTPAFKSDTSQISKPKRTKSPDKIETLIEPTFNKSASTSALMKHSTQNRIFSSSGGDAFKKPKKTYLSTSSAGHAYEGAAPTESIVRHIETKPGIRYKWFALKPMIEITDLDAIKQVFRDHSSSYGRFWAYGKCPIVHERGGQMKRVFRIFSISLNDDEYLTRILPTIQKESQSLVSHMYDNRDSVFRLKSLIKNFTISCLANVYMGSSEEAYECMKANYFFYNKKTIGFIHYLFPWLLKLPTAYAEKYNAMRKKRRFYSMLAMRAYYNCVEPNNEEFNGVPEETILNHLAEESSKDREGLTLEEIQTGSYLINSSSILGPLAVLQNVIFVMMRYPDAQKKLKEEIEYVLKKNGHTVENFTLQDIREMVYLDLVLREVLRLFPPYPCLIPRVANEHDRILGYRIPQGSFITCPIIEALRNPVYFKEPNKFIPERFIYEPHESKAVSELSFGFGTRRCLGIRLAKIILKVVMINIFSQMQLSLESSGCVKTSKNYTVVVPDPGILFKASFDPKIKVPRPEE